MTSTPGHAPLHFKIVIDATAPHAQADFWAAALHYTVEDNSALIEKLLGFGAVPPELTVESHGRRAWRDLAAVRHPTTRTRRRAAPGWGGGCCSSGCRRPRPGRNRVHLDVHAAEGRRAEEVARLEALGASVLRQVKEPGGEWVVMADPEGNEFCVH